MTKAGVFPSFYLYLLTLSLSAGSSALAATAGVRSVFLNGVDISSARAQTLSHVDVKIDANGNLYIDAPQYEAQIENTFVPLGRPVPASSPIEHKAPTSIRPKVDDSINTPASALATPPETGDTLRQPSNGAAPEEARAPVSEKEGTRTPPDGNQPPAGP